MPNFSWLRRDVSYEVLMSDDWLSLNLAERGLLESVSRAIILTGPLSDDAKLIARRIGADVAEVETAWPAVKRLLQSDESGKLVHAETVAAIRAERMPATRSAGKPQRRAKQAANLGDVNKLSNGAACAHKPHHGTSEEPDREYHGTHRRSHAPRFGRGSYHRHQFGRSARLWGRQQKWPALFPLVRASCPGVLD